jgi:hypothetical protein
MLSVFPQNQSHQKREDPDDFYNSQYRFVTHFLPPQNHPQAGVVLDVLHS